MVIAIVFSVLLYRLAIAGLLYRAVSGISGGPSIGDIAVSITGAVIQLVAIIIMNRVYEYLAYKLTNWGERPPNGLPVHVVISHVLLLIHLHIRTVEVLFIYLSI